MVNPIEYVEGKIAPEVARVTKFEGKDYLYSEMTKFPRSLFNQKEIEGADGIKAAGMKIANGVFLFALVSQPVGWMFIGAHALLAICGNAWDKYQVKRLSNEQREIEKDVDENLKSIKIKRQNNTGFSRIEGLQQTNEQLIKQYKENKLKLERRRVIALNNQAMSNTSNNEEKKVGLINSVNKTSILNKHDKEFRIELEVQFDCIISLLNSKEIRDTELLFEVKTAKSAIYITHFQGLDAEYENMILVRNRALKSLGIDDAKDQKKELRALLQKEKINFKKDFNNIELLKKELPEYIEILENQIELIIKIFEKESLLNGDYDSISKKPGNIFLVEIGEKSELFKDINKNINIVYADRPLKNNLEKILEARNSILRVLGIFDSNDQLIPASST